MASTTQPPPSNEKGRGVQTSLGKFHPRKISMGILPDSSSHSWARPKDFTTQTDRTPTQSKPIAAKVGEQLKNKEASPWISTRSFRQKSLVAEHPPGTAEPIPPVLLPTKPVMERDYPVHSSRDGATVVVEKVSFATLRSMSEENLDHPAFKAETKGSETLRMKLWEILGTMAPSNNEHGLDVEIESMSPLQNMDEGHVPAVELIQNPHRLNIEAKNMPPLENSEEQGNPIAKPRKNSDGLRMEAENMTPAKNDDEGSVPGAKLSQNSHNLHMHTAEEHVHAANPRKNSSCLKMQAKNKVAFQKDDKEAVPIAKPRQNSHGLNMQTRNMTSLHNKDQERVPVAKPRQNSDTIETDSECPPNIVVGRSGKRSLTRKRAAGRSKTGKIKNAPSTHPKKERKGVSNNSVLKERFSRRLQYGISCGPKTSTRKICQRFSSNFRDQSLFSVEVENQSVNSQNEGIPSHAKSQLQVDTGKDDDESKGVFIQTKRVALEIDSRMSEHLRKMVCCPKIRENKSQTKEKLDDCCRTFGVNLTEEKYVPDSPPSNIREPAKEASPGTPKKAELGGADNDCPGKPLLNKKGIQSFKDFFSSRSNFVMSDPEQEDSSDDVGQFEYSPASRKSKPVTEKEPERRMSLSPSSSEDSDLLTSKEFPPAKGFGKSTLTFPEVPTVGKSDFFRHLNKKHFFKETAKASELLSSVSTENGKTVLEEDGKRQAQVDTNEEDGLPSVISLFALALERVKSKMKSMVKKKSAEILMSVAEGIQFQLQTAQHQIQADMVKLASINKLKRKRVDTRFEGLEGQLKVIHARFKDEVNRHLEDCRSTVESLETYQLELKATVEKQSVSHKKLLLQAKKAIETQLNDAQKRITEVHDLARRKMSRLKHDVADCF